MRVDLDETQLGAGLGGQELPGDNSAALRGQDRIAGAQVLQAPGEADQVDRLGRVARPDDLGRLGGVDEARHLDACLLEGLGGPLGGLVDAAAMDVGVVVRVVVDQRVDDGLRLLRARHRESR